MLRELSSTPDITPGQRILARRLSAASDPVSVALRRLSRSGLGRPQAVRSDRFQGLARYFQDQLDSVERYRREKDTSTSLAKLVSRIKGLSSPKRPIGLDPDLKCNWTNWP